MDMAAIHHEALALHLERTRPATDEGRKLALELAGKFLAECLSAFEMAQRSFQESIAALKSLNERLEEEVHLRTSELAESEERYRSLIQVSPDGITVTDLKGRITLSNQQAAIMHGYASPEEEIGMEAGQFVAPEDIPRVAAVAQRVLKMSATQSIEYTMLTKNGERIPVEARVTVMTHGDGQPASFVGVVRDVSGRKEAELMLQRKARQQAAVAALGQMALNDTDITQLQHETVRLVTQTLDVEYCQLLELVPGTDTLILRDGAGWKEGSIGVRKLKTTDSQSGFTLLAAGPVIVDNLADEHRFNPPVFLLEHGIVSGVSVVIHSDGYPYGALGAHTDYQRTFTVDESLFLQSMANMLALAIKNRHLLESEATRRVAAERANEERLKTLAMVNHELRTPLSSIKGFATTLLADDVVWSPQDQLDFIRTINEEADKLSGMIEQILEISRMDAGHMVMDPVKQPFSAIVERVMAQLNAVTGQHTLVFDLPEGLPLVLADTQRSGQVLVNLVENAAKYSPPETTITVSAGTDGDFLMVKVADQGRGIAAEDREKVFQPFYRAEKSAKSKKGAGLGLYICQRLVEAQGGQISILDHDGPGATIAFTLPLAIASVRKM